MRSNVLISRRTCLTGLGVSLSLPLLETMGWADGPKAAWKPPVRLGFMYMPHGVIPERFWPKDSAGKSARKIDAAGDLPGGLHFTTPADLKRIIADRKDDFCRNLTSKLLAYVLGRQLEGYDEIIVDQVTNSIKKDDYRMQSLVLNVVTSDPFTHRRVTNTGETPNAK